MLDFVRVSTVSPKRGVVEIVPKFKIKNSSDLMIRGGDFYAIWDERNKLWSTDEEVAVNLIDEELEKYAKTFDSRDDKVIIKYMWDASSGSIDIWHKYVQKQMWDQWTPLDERLTFANHETVKKDYASKRLPYPICPGDISAWDKLIGTLYDASERHKIEWAIGAIVSGESKHIQKFLVLYGSAGTGKSTILNIIQKLFEGYYSVFDAKALGSLSNVFALEAFKSNPLVAIQHDGDLSRIEDNTRLNSVVSHELMTVNEKFKATYSNKFNAFLFMGTNKPVKITDAKSGIIRRLIDVHPSGNKIPVREYNKLVKQIDFELGAIASHCLEVYMKEPDMYDDYIPVQMLGASNDFYNFILDSYMKFKKDDGISLKEAYDMYKIYCEESKSLAYSLRIFKEELRNYFRNFEERVRTDDGVRIRNYYSGFITDKFEYDPEKVKPKNSHEDILELNCTKSLLDEMLSDSPAQYTKMGRDGKSEIPVIPWEIVTTKLKDIDTSKVHYVKPNDIHHIVIDFDIKDSKGNKNFELNAKAAALWPKTYAELSKGGSGVHLHYIYEGDVTELKKDFDKDIEIKTFAGGSSLRRRLTKCNDIPVAILNTGLPKKGAKKSVVKKEYIITDKSLHERIISNLNKEVHADTRSSMDFIKHILDEAYESGVVYDVSDLEGAIFTFASHSTNQSKYCIELMDELKLKSEREPEYQDSLLEDLIILDTEVYPNFFGIAYTPMYPEDAQVIKLFNPSSEETRAILEKSFGGYNNRKYDNHIMHARAYFDYDNYQLFRLSNRIVSNDSNVLIGNAYNHSKIDVYDLLTKKQSLKKWEIELGHPHMEMDIPWDQPVDPSDWPRVMDYCANDVLATKAVLLKNMSDFEARVMLAAVSGLSTNHTNNQHTAKIIFGDEKKPSLNYTDFATGITSDALGQVEVYKESNYFEGYEYIQDPKTFKWKNMYRGRDMSRGGRVFAIPGMYGRVVTFDVASMHPHSIIELDLFGIYTKRFKELVDARIAIKHGDFDTASKLLDGKLAPYLKEGSNTKALANALKIVINSVYGLTSASFENVFKDPRNINNIVALRGALFMTNLQDEIEAMGGTVVHIKTDSIKVVDPSEEITNFIFEYGKKYGYTFEIEHIFEKFCLVNDAVYISKLAEDDPDEPGEWSATGKQFQIPYIFKSMFSHEPIEFSDKCVTHTAQTALYLDFNEDLPDDSAYVKEVKKIKKKLQQPDITDDEYAIGMKRIEELDAEIAKCHNYIFIGKAGSFMPVKDGCGGGRLVREKDGKFDAASGTIGYRWKESEVIKANGLEDDFSDKYFADLIETARETIEKYGDYEWFVN